MRQRKLRFRGMDAVFDRKRIYEELELYPLQHINYEGLEVLARRRLGEKRLSQRPSMPHLGTSADLFAMAGGESEESEEDTEEEGEESEEDTCACLPPQLTRACQPCPLSPMSGQRSSLLPVWRR